MPRRKPARPYRPHIWVEPGLRFGASVIAGTGLEVDLIAGRYWHLGYDETVPAYDLTRADLLLAAWYVARYAHGRCGREERAMREAFKAWAEANETALWEGEYAGIPLPPRKGDADG